MSLVLKSSYPAWIDFSDVAMGGTKLWISQAEAGRKQMMSLTKLVNLRLRREEEAEKERLNFILKSWRKK